LITALVLLFDCNAAIAASAAESPPPATAYRIGVLERLPAARNTANMAALRQGMQELGYIEGKSFAIVYRSADGRSDRFPALAKELVSLKVNVIVTRGTPAALAAKSATTTIPIVMSPSGDPLLSGLVASFARSGANITGLSTNLIDLAGKRLEFLRQIVPGVPRIAAIMNTSNPAIALEWKELLATAQRTNIQLQLLDVRQGEDLRRAFETGIRQRVGAVLVGIDDLTQMHQRDIIDLAAANRLPAMFASREFADAGGLISYGVDYPDLYRRAAKFVDKVLKGAAPGDLPIEQPTKFDLVINLKTAKALGLAIPQSLLLRADHVIE
jgi:putative ABC transport system substrate-binding protein